jgi:hypothetical protein
MISGMAERRARRAMGSLKGIRSVVECYCKKRLFVAKGLIS